MRIRCWLIIILAGWLLWGGPAWAAGSPPSAPTSGELFYGPNAIADIVEKAGGAVVNIDVVKNIRVLSPVNMFGGNEFFFDFVPEFREYYRERVIPQKGAGSGFIIDRDGHILTNEHVVRGADGIEISLRDGRKFKGKIIGSDAALDVAIIKIEAADLPFVVLGESEKLRPGEWVVAIGNPYGFANTVTAGIVSAVNRDLKDLGKNNLIQTDAAINPGNSGGPLLNLKGEVVGINVAIVAGAQSIGFAIPIASVKEIIAELIESGRVVRPWLGIYMRDVDEKIADYFGLPLAQGVIVSEVVKDSPAEKMGVKKYDIIRAIDNNQLKSAAEISGMIARMRPGDEVVLTIYRQEREIILKGKLAERR